MKTHLIFLWFITFGVMACTSQPGVNTGENKVEGDTIPVLLSSSVRLKNRFARLLPMQVKKVQSLFRR